MGKINIAIVAGGDSSEREISLRGAEFYMSFLDSQKYNSTIIDLSKNAWLAKYQDKTFDVDKNDFSFTDDCGTKHNFDLAIIIIHGTPGENGILQAYFELIGLPYASGGVASSVISFDKEFCKAVVKEYGIKTAKGITIHRGDKIDFDKICEFGFPLFIKPNASGSSFGVTKVKTKEDIQKAIDYAFTEDDVVLVEKALIGREISCGAYALDGTIYALPVTEIVSKREYFDYEAKYNGESDEITPADLSPEVVKKLNDYTKTVYKALRCKYVVRVDYIIQDNEPYMIEINNIPGMSAQSIIPQEIASSGQNISELYDKIINEILKK